MKVTVIPVVIKALGTVLQGLKKGAGRVGNWRMNRDHTNNSNIKICQNTEKSPGDQKRLAVSHTPLKHQLTIE